MSNSLRNLFFISNIASEYTDFDEWAAEYIAQLESSLELATARFKEAEYMKDEAIKQAMELNNALLQEKLNNIGKVHPCDDQTAANLANVMASLDVEIVHSEAMMKRIKELEHEVYIQSKAKHEAYETIRAWERNACKTTNSLENTLKLDWSCDTISS